VGELNHRGFWAFLAFQTWVNGAGMIEVQSSPKTQFINSLDYHYEIDHQSGHETYRRPYYLLFALAFVALCFLIFTTILLVYHTTLLCIGSTTWEQTKRESITYLKAYPRYYNPFNQGTMRNLQAAFCHGNVLRQWELPTYTEARALAREQFNCIEN
jgi:hypothetical protein